MLTEYTINSISDETGFDRRKIKKALSEVQPHRIDDSTGKDVGYYYLKVWGPILFGSSKPAATGDDTREIGELKRLNEAEVLRERQRENDLADGLVVTVAEMKPLLSKHGRHLAAHIDTLPGKIEGTTQNCPNCDHKMILDGRATERVRNVLVKYKNTIANAHTDLD